MPYVTGREAFFEVARTEGARYLFANPGTTELPLFDELADPDPPLELILALQEATAVAAADGYAQATRRPSLVNLHIAPGVANGLGNIFNAKWAGSPVVVTAGNQNTNQQILEPMLAADLVEMTRQFCKWSYEVRRPEDVGVALRRAFKIAASPPTGPVFLSIPWNYLDEGGEAEIPPPSRIEHGAAADPRGVADAARSLLEAERPIVIAGDDVARSGAVAELVVLAEAIGARVVGEPLSGRLVFPMDHPLWTGSLLPVSAMIRSSLEQADVALLVGALAFSPFFYTPVSAVPPGVKLVQIDPDPYQIAKTFPVALGLRGDTRATLSALVAEVGRARTPEQARRVEARTREYADARRAALDGLEQAVASHVDRTPVAAIAACAEVVAGFDGEPVSVVDESVTATTALRSVLRQRDPDSYFFFRGGGLGWGIPAAIGVKLAQPDRNVVAVSGDGAALYVPQALWTLAHHDIPVTVVVLNNGGYYILKAQLLGMGGKAAKEERFPGMDIAGPPVDFMALAQAFGVPAERVESGREIAPAVRKAMSSGGPALVEIAIDPSVRPLG